MLHEGSPSFSINAPGPWLNLPSTIQEQGRIGSDLCYYSDEDGAHYFVRVVIEIPIHGVSDPFMWGVWVSLSQASYEHYIETSDAPDLGRVYFGWLCNTLPYYESTYAMASDVQPRAGGIRPCLRLHEVDHELYSDQANGISIEKAQKIAEVTMHGKQYS